MSHLHKLGTDSMKSRVRITNPYTQSYRSSRKRWRQRTCANNDSDTVNESACLNCHVSRVARLAASLSSDDDDDDDDDRLSSSEITSGSRSLQLDTLPLILYVRLWKLQSRQLHRRSN
jgi:hypothetical protein